MFMRDMYESHYGIYNHLSQTIRRPLASVAMHPAEEINEGSLLENTFKVFIEAKIGEIAKISLLEYLELPTDIAKMLLEQCQAAAKRTSNLVDDVTKSLQNPM